MIWKSKRKCITTSLHVYAFARAFLVIIAILKDVVAHTEANVMTNSNLIVEITKQYEMDAGSSEIIDSNLKNDYMGKRKRYFRKNYDKPKQTRRMKEKNNKNKSRKKDESDEFLDTPSQTTESPKHSMNFDPTHTKESNPNIPSSVDMFSHSSHPSKLLPSEPSANKRLQYTISSNSPTWTEFNKSGQPPDSPSRVISIYPIMSPSQYPSNIGYEANEKSLLPSLLTTLTPSYTPSDSMSTSALNISAFIPLDNYPIEISLASINSTSVNQPFPRSSLVPSITPSIAPMNFTFINLQTPSSQPSLEPSQRQSNTPSIGPTKESSLKPSQRQSVTPSIGPTEEPSLKPSQRQSVTPSIGPTEESSLKPSQRPTVAPSIDPTEESSSEPSSDSSLSPTNVSNIPSLSPSQIPTLYKSQSPSENTIKDSMNSITTSPSLVLQQVDILPFTMLILIDGNEIQLEIMTKISSDHMTKMFHDNISSDLNFAKLSLSISQRGRGRLRSLALTDNIFDFTGVAFFQTSKKIEKALVNQARMKSFDSNGMKTFVSLLKDSGMNASNAFLVTTQNDTISTEGDIDKKIAPATTEDLTSQRYRFNYLKEIRGLIAALTITTFIIIGLVVYKVRRRMISRHITDSDSDSNVKYESEEDEQSYDEKQLFSGSHSIYRIEEEQSHDLLSMQSSKQSISLT